MLPEIVTDPSVLETIFTIRWRAFIEIGVPGALYPDENVRDTHDDCGTHFALLDGNTVQAAARISVHHNASQLPSPHYFSEGSELLSSPIASMNRLVVPPEFRSNGYARLLDEHRIEFAKQQNCESIVIYIHELSGESRLAAVKALGFTCLYGDRLTEDPFWGGNGHALYLEI